MIDLKEAIHLVGKAFDQPRQKGRPDWNTMTSAVLNNRLLGITDRKFDARRYGAKDFQDLLVKLYPWVHVMRKDNLLLVEWRGDVVSKPSYKAPSGTLLTAGGVRGDLWTSIIDYRSGKVYVWDTAKNQAREALPKEALPVLPTVTPDEMNEWRSEFLEMHKSNLAGAALVRALRWKEQSLSAALLPESLQKQWNRELTQRVRRRLESFFGEQTEISQDVDTARTPVATELDETPLLDEDGVKAARDRGHAYVAGELLAKAFPQADDDFLETLLARAIAAWASPLQAAEEPLSLQDLISKAGEFSGANLAVATVNALHRIKQHQRNIPDEISDLAFKIKEDLYRIFGIELRTRPIEACKIAIATLESGLSRVAAAVDIFLRSTLATAKAASLDILKATHQLQPLILPTDRNFLRELEIVLGAAFRKFCESHERRDDTDVVRRAPELREILARFAATQGDNRESSSIWLAFVAPVMQRVNELVDEATSKGELSLSPVLGLVNPITKTNLQSPDQEIRLTFRLANTGRGQALNVSMDMLPHPHDAIVLLAEPRTPFSVSAESDQVVTLSLVLSSPLPQAEFPIRWACKTASGTGRTFADKIVISQQSVEPDWDKLLSEPPYSLNPIKRRERLYGRATTLHQLRLAALAGASTFLWGQKRIGKTSLLQVLAVDLAARADTSCLILRMGEVTSLHEGQLAHRIAERLIEVSGIEMQLPEESDLGAGMGQLIPFVEKLTAKKPNHKFVVVIDEFDDLDPAFYTGERGRQFIKALRSLSEIGLTFFFVGSERMDTIYSRHQSDLNKWRNLALDRLDNRDECKALITEPVAGAIEYSQQAIDAIIDYCAGNPFYIHNFCYQIFERCVQEHRTFIGENDLQVVRQQLLRSLGQTNFAHFWEDNPELDVAAKLRQAAENCIALTCIAVLGGRYTLLDELVQVQDSLPISHEDRASLATLRTTCERLRARRILAPLTQEPGFSIALPLFREWLAENADPRLLAIWTAFTAHLRSLESAQPVVEASILDVGTFPIPEEELIAISQRLVYCGHQKDAAEIRQWLRQFDDESRIEIAYLLLRRLTERGFINEGSKSRTLHKVTEMVNSRRQEIGKRAWTVIRSRLDNLCITYVDSEHKSGAATARELQKIMRPGKCAASGEVGSWMRSHVDDDCIVVIADDFAGTGKTLTIGIKAFEKSVDPIIWRRYVDEGRVAAYVMFAFPDAMKKVSKSCPGIEVIAAQSLGDDLRALDEEAGIFANDAERRFAGDVLMQIGRELTPQSPLGFGDLGALVVFHNAAPNNTLPIFWSGGRVNERAWKPLFPRA